MSESYLQYKLVQYLKGKGCYVIKTQPGPGVPVGCPDVIFIKGSVWGAAECKATETSRYQPLQKETIAKLGEWGWCKAVYPKNYNQIIEELNILLT